MKYRDLIQFDPIETVVQLRDADDLSRATQLVSTFVISEEMAERLLSIVIPQLQFDHPADNRGLLIVGNYGTGKSHLMSVITAVAEHAELLGKLEHDAARKSAAQIAGRFKVARAEIGSTQMSLRDIVVAVLEEFLESLGVAYRFPPATQVINSKASFEDMMAAFEVKHPGMGVLLAVDELLDFLRTRKDQELIQDLQFLREVGEVCKDLRFRFIGGLQETLFDNARFSFVAGTVLRVRDRFEQVLIARKDVKYVVAQRLLKKTPQQRAAVEERLSGFAKYYEGMAGRMEEFVSMFPIHPDYVEVFDRLVVVERREVLRTLSRAMERMLDSDLPEDQPGILSFDAYWETLRQNPAFRTIPDVREVIDCSNKLESLIDTQYPKGRNKAFARRIIHGLSVHRLSTGNIDTAVGLTAPNLRDMLCLYDPLVAEMGGDPADDLRGEVEVALITISRVVNGQFLSSTERDARGTPSGQFYLDARKVVDYDAQLDKRAEALSEDELDRYYFEALKRVMECVDQTYVTGYRIWEHELEWQERRATRLGYLFFGTPNERSTAAPPRDFYIYFMPHKSSARFRDEKLSNDVFFKLKETDDAFSLALTKYAAASILFQESSGQAKSVYETKAYGYLRELVRWLQGNMAASVTVTCQGKTRKMMEWLTNRPAAAGAKLTNVRDMVNAVASACLAPHFENAAPEYPKFATLITSSNRAQAGQDALRFLRGLARTQQGTAVLDALELLDGERVNVTHSRYAAYIIQLLRQKPAGQVLNRNELIENVQGVEYMAARRYRLEPEWVAVLLGALVYNGDAVLVLPGEKFDAANFDRLVAKPVQELANFKHIEPPKEWNIAALRALFELVGLPPGSADMIAQGQEASFKQLQTAVEERARQIATMRHRLQSVPAFWGKGILADQELAGYQRDLDAAKTFFDGVQNYRTAAQLKNFQHDVSSVKAQQPALDTLNALQALFDLLAELQPFTGYLAQAELVLPPEYPWLERAKALRDELATQLAAPAQRAKPGFRQQALQKLTALKQDYAGAYLALHGRARLTAEQDHRKVALMRDPRLIKLRQLGRINPLWHTQLVTYQARLGNLQSCFTLTQADLQNAAICPQCSFNPARESASQPVGEQLKQFDAEQDRLLADFTRTLLEELQAQVTQPSIAAMQEADRDRIALFIRGQKLPEPLSEEFVEAVKEALSGLQQVFMKQADVQACLSAGGLPATPDEIKQRFERYVDSLAHGKDPAKVRVALITLYD